MAVHRLGSTEKPKPFHDDVTRSLHALSLGMVKAVDRRDARKAELSVRHTVVNFQLPIAGAAVSTMTWGAIGLDFDYRFYYSPGTVDSDYDTPNFTYGLELQGLLENLPLVTAHVAGWKRDPDNDAVIGATLQVGAMLPGATEETNWSGKLHASFTGYATLFEDETEMTE